MNLSRLAMTGLLTLAFLAAGSIATDVIARQQPDNGYEDMDSGPDSDDLGGAQQEFERMITPEYRRLGMRGAATRWQFATAPTQRGDVCI